MYIWVNNMNILAHLFLSQSDINLMVGNFIADHIKGNKIAPYSEEITRGIMMHRAIDTFTDQHPLVMKSKVRLHPKYHKYAGVLVDLFYDHILAKNFSNYSPIPITTFSKSAYISLKSKASEFPERSKLVLKYMSEQDWLTNYSTISGMKKTFIGISKRTKFKSRMEEAAFDLEKDFKIYEKEFNLFFKDLFEYCRIWRSQN